MKQYGTKAQCEYLRQQARQKFDPLRATWIECGKWAAPFRIQWLLSQTQGQRNNQHIVDATHILALRSYVAGFLEGNTSATRPWYYIGTGDPYKDNNPKIAAWLDIFVQLTLSTLSSSNFYHAAGMFYYDYGVFNTGGYFIDELKNKLFFHNLVPGSYFVINNSLGEAVVLVRESALSVKALVDEYGKKRDGNWDWSNFSGRVRRLYEDGNYTELIDIVQIVEENKDFDPEKPIAGMNKKWIAKTYELGGNGGQYYTSGMNSGAGISDDVDEDVYLRISTSRRKPFIIGKSDTSGNFEYGQKGPTLDALGSIKSLNKKAIGKDMALDQMLQPTIQGPANLRKSYVTSQSRSYIPLDPSSQKIGLRPVFEMNPAVGAITQDVIQLQQQVDRLYYADYLLFLSRNPKTRTAEETKAVVNEQQLVIGPNLQSLNFTHNIPVVDFIADFTLDMDPRLPPFPDELAGESLRPEFISVFAQAQKAADLPSVEHYMRMIAEVGQLRPEIWYKANLDKLADIYEDRLYLPVGLNNPTEKAEALREQAIKQQQQKEQMEQMVQAAGAAKDIGINVNQNKGVQ